MYRRKDVPNQNAANPASRSSVCSLANPVKPYGHALRTGNLSLLPLTGMNIVQKPGYSREAIEPRDLSPRFALLAAAFHSTRRLAPSASINARVTRPYLHRNNYCRVEQDASDPCTTLPPTPHAWSWSTTNETHPQGQWKSLGDTAHDPWSQINSRD